MFNAFDKVRDHIASHGIEMVDLKFCDLWGRWRHITVPAPQFLPSIMEEGIGFDGSSVGFRSVESGDMVLVPDLSTAMPDPFWDVPTLSFICRTLEADSKHPSPSDPRDVAARAEAYLRATGIADASRWGPEFEFYVFDDVRFESSPNASSYRVDSKEADWNSGEAGTGHHIPLHGGYHAIPPRDRLYNLRAEMTMLLADMGVPVKYHHHEVGGPGQLEIETPLVGMMDAGDMTMIVKYVAKMVAHRRGQAATFMPKPLYGEAGNGMHFHQQLWKDGENVFFDADGYGCLSQTARYYIGGLLTHAPAVLGLTNPSTNSYRRLVPGFEAPVNIFYSLGNRSAAIRIPKYTRQPDTARFEFRPPDATCNVYLALAAQLMAGIDGIRRRIDPEAAGFGPIDDDIHAWSDTQRKERIRQLPGTLDQALYALEGDQAFLLEGGVFTEDMLERWIRYKRKRSLEVRNRPHPHEVALYFDL